MWRRAGEQQELGILEVGSWTSQNTGDFPLPEIASFTSVNLNYILKKQGMHHNFIYVDLLKSRAVAWCVPILNFNVLLCPSGNKDDAWLVQLYSYVRFLACERAVVRHEDGKKLATDSGQRGGAEGGWVVGGCVVLGGWGW